MNIRAAPVMFWRSRFLASTPPRGHSWRVGFAIVATLAVPFYTFAAFVCGRGLLHRKQQREERAATWTSRWGAQAAHVYQNSIEIQTLGYLGVATALVLLLVT